MPGLDQLVDELRRVVHRYSPDWTDSRSSDPGITLLELLAFLTGDLLFRADQAPERWRPYLAELMSRLTRLEALIGTQVPRARPGPKRVRYFSGQLLSADDFTAEQNYFLGKQKTVNRLLLGYGVASGLDTTVGGGTVTVSPGLALDRRGNEIIVNRSIALKIPGGRKPVFLLLEYLEKETDPVPAGHGMQASRIEEGFRLAFASVPSPGAVPLAKLTRRSGRWSLSQGFRVPRSRCGIPAGRRGK
jgi:hypothetical protein